MVHPWVFLSVSVTLLPLATPQIAVIGKEEVSADSAALDADDECLATGVNGHASCALSALQLRGAQLRAQPQGSLDETVPAAPTPLDNDGAPIDVGVDAVPTVDVAGGRCSPGYTPSHPQRNQDCRGTRLCCDPLMRCYEKGPSWAGCMYSCSPGLRWDEPPWYRFPWSCRVLGGGIAPAPAPPPPQPQPGPSPSPGGGGSLNEPSNAPLYTFHMYRAMSSSEYPPENVNTANLAGVLWYLNNEVVTKTPRKYGINRIVRYKVSTRATNPLAAKGMNFGVRFAFDSGQCTGPYDCNQAFKQYGYFVGCNNLGDFPFPNYPVHYPGAVWYSLPGKCPSRTYGRADASCRLNEPGGACASPTGTGSCTFSYEKAGEISLTDLEGGKGQSFWDGLTDDSACQARLERAKALFALTADGPDLPNPSCDFNRDAFYR